MKKIFLALLPLALGMFSLIPARANIVLLSSPDTNSGELINSSLSGEIYRYEWNHSPSSVAAIMAPGSDFKPVLVGTFTANTTGQIAFGVANDGNKDSVPLGQFLNGSTLSDLNTGDAATIHYNSANSAYPNNDVLYGNYGTFLTLSGYTYVPASEVGKIITYTIGSDDGATLSIQGTPVITEGGIHAVQNFSQDVEYLNAGIYSLQIGYYDGHATQAAFDLNITGGDINHGGIVIVAPPAAVPEPTTWAMSCVLASAVGVVAYRRRQ